MVNNMTAKDYLMIQENVVTNICVWDGNANSWQPPLDATMLVKETTATKVWVINYSLKEYELIESVGDADIGFNWDGVFCNTNQPKPIYEEPKNSIPQTIIS